MKFNLNIQFRNFAGDPIIENGKPVMMAEYIGKTLFAFGSGGAVTLEQPDMMKAYEIVRKMQTCPSDVILSSEEVTFIKEKMAALLTVGCYGQLYKVLEQED